MTETYKFSTFEEKSVQTADDYYSPTQVPDYKKTTVSSLQLTLASLKTQLRQEQIEQTSLKQKINELDLAAGKLVITNQYLSAENDSLNTKHAEYLTGKEELLNEIKEWKNTVNCLKAEAMKGGQELKLWKGRVVELQEKQQQLREKIQVQIQLNQQVEGYLIDLDDQTRANESQISDLKTHRDCLAQTASTLETFAKSFKRNIQQKQTEINRAKFQTSELQSMLSSKAFERSNFDKEKDKTQWQSKMYVHHNKEIQKTNDKLKQDLEKLLSHLESLQKNNKHLSNCIQQYSDTGIAAAKKILKQSNK